MPVKCHWLHPCLVIKGGGFESCNRHSGSCDTLAPMGYKDPAQQREYQRKWMAQRREDFFHDKVCVDCGSSSQLEIDHVDPSQKVSHRLWSWSKARRDAELEKCVVRCKPCHLEKSIKSDFLQPSHGTRHMYEKYKCKCPPCKEAKAVHNRKRYVPA